MRLDHAFVPSFTDTNLCNRPKCNQPKDKHGPNAVCDACSKTGVLQVRGNGIAMCPDCVQEDIDASLPSVPVEQLTASTLTNKVLVMSREVDNSIRFSADVFNSKPVAIIEIEAAVKADDSIPADKKQGVIIAKVQESIEAIKKAMLADKQIQMEVQKRIEANQAEHIRSIKYLQAIAAGLTDEQRKAHRLQDLSYDPKDPKHIKPKVEKPKAPKKESLTEVLKQCALMGLDASSVQALMVGKGITMWPAIAEILEAKKKSGK